MTPDRCPTCNMRAPRRAGGGWAEHIRVCAEPWSCLCVDSTYKLNGECNVCHRSKIDEAREDELRAKGLVR